MANIQDLQKQVINLLEQVSELMSRASTKLWFEDGSESKYNKYQQEVDNERGHVENLELRMAITAPMNAGKSTIINAIIGRELLPSYSTAMTTLPTEIVFKANSTKPILILSSQSIISLQKALKALKQKIEAQGINQVLQETAEYPHLADFIYRIHNLRDFSIPKEIFGYEEINSKLTDLNHIIRLCNILKISEDLLNSLTEIDIPRIETPFWRSQQNAQSEKLGNLIIIDTPGPNEAGVSNKLESIVSKQLENSQLVLIVLDFTSLRAEAAEKIKEEVQKVIKTRGTKNLYVLVNKIDQRGEGDITPEQVKQFVANNLKLVDSKDMNRIFEISAKQAFLSTSFQQELQQYPDVKVSEMKTAPAFAKSAFGTLGWGNALELFTKEQLSISAVQLWDQSRFGLFLEKAINAIMEEVAPHCIESALNLSIVRLQGLCADTTLRRSAIAKKAEEIQEGIKVINLEIESLKDCRNDLNNKLLIIKNQLHPKVNKSINKLKIDVHDWLNNNLANYAEGYFKQLFPENIKLIPNPGIYGFQRSEEAESFAYNLAENTRHIIENRLNDTCKYIEKETDKMVKELANLLDINTQLIIDNAKERLKKDFDVSFNLETIKLANVYARINQPVIKYHTKSDLATASFWDKVFDNVFEYMWQNLVLENIFVKIVQNGITFMSFLFGYKIEQKAKYIINIKIYIEEVSNLIEEKCEEITIQAEAYIESYFHDQVDQHFKYIDYYLANYNDDLAQSLKDQNLPFKKLEELKQALDSFVEGSDRLEIDQLIFQINQLLEETKCLFSK